MHRPYLVIGLFVAALATTACEPPQTAPSLVTSTPAPPSADAPRLQLQGSPVSILDRKP
jgi:hypothetical protein